MKDLRINHAIFIDIKNNIARYKQELGLSDWMDEHDVFEYVIKFRKENADYIESGNIIQKYKDMEGEE